MRLQDRPQHLLNAMTPRHIAHADAITLINAANNQGYQIDFKGQTAIMYNGDNCTGSVSYSFSGSIGPICSPIGWRSVKISC